MSETRNRLTPEEAWVILQKGTERPFTGEYDQHFEAGYYCLLYTSPSPRDGLLSRMPSSA